MSETPHDLFQDFVTYTSGTEAPDVFFRWGALSALSSLAGRRIWANQGTIVHYPNLNVFLVGPPGVAKSTVLRVVRHLVAKVNDKLPVAADAVTLPALLQTLASPEACITFTVNGKQQTYQHVSVFANELITFLGSEPTQMVNFLTDVWDTPVFQNQTKNKGHDKIVGPFVTTLGCLTPHTLANPTYRHQLVTGGFSRRVCFCYGDLPNTPVAFPEKTATQLAALERCVARGKEITRLSGEFIWTDEARERFTQFHTGVFNRKKRESDPAIVSYLNSADGLVIKLAMLLRLASSNELVLTHQAIDAAVILYEESLVNMQRVFLNTGRNELASYTNDILDAIKTKFPDGITIRELTRRFLGNLRDNELTECLSQLTRTGLIKLVRIKFAKVDLDGYVYVPDEVSSSSTTLTKASAEAAQQTVDRRDAPA